MPELDLSLSAWPDARKSSDRDRAVAAGRDLTGEIVFLARALKKPTLRDVVGQLAEHASGPTLVTTKGRPAPALPGHLRVPSRASGLCW